MVEGAIAVALPEGQPLTFNPVESGKSQISPMSSSLARPQGRETVMVQDCVEIHVTADTQQCVSSLYVHVAECDQEYKSTSMDLSQFCVYENSLTSRCTHEVTRSEQYPRMDVRSDCLPKGGTEQSGDVAFELFDQHLTILLTSV